MKPITDRSYRGLLWILALGGTLLDQVSKYGVFKWLYDSRELQGHCEVIPGAFRLLTQFSSPREALEHGLRGGPDRDSLLGTVCQWLDQVTVKKNVLLAPLRTWSGDLLPKVNQGALFGLGGRYAEVANALFAVISIVAAVAIVYWSTRRSTARDFYLCTSLGLILAGTLGNLYDRLVFDGVRDFLYFHLIEWPVFNVADCCLVCGAFLLLGQAFLNRSPVGEKSHTAMSHEMAEAN